MNRLEILEMFLAQSEDLEKIKQELELTKKQLEEANKKLEDKKLKSETVGSLAEEALALSGIFEDAQKAVDLYTNAIKNKTANVASEIQQMRAQAEEECKQMRENTIKKCQKQLELFAKNISE